MLICTCQEPIVSRDNRCLYCGGAIKERTKPTLQDIKKANGLTNTDIAKALNCSTSKAGMVLQGRHIRVYHDEDIDQLARILGITFERCWLAMCESYNQWNKTPGRKHQRADEFRAEVQAEMQEKMPDLGIEIDVPREMTTIESVLVMPKERRLNHGNPR